MTVSSSISREQYATDGVTTVFTIHFAFFEDTNVNAALVDSGGVSTTLILNTDFTAVPTFDADGNPTGGSATMMVAPAIGGTLTLFRIIPLTQESKYVENDTFPAARAMGDFDLAVMRDQQLQDAVSRSLSFPVTVDPGVSAELPAPTADTYLGWNSAGDALEDKTLPVGTAVYSSIGNTKTGTATAEAVTPDGLAALWQEGGALVAAASISKPASASLGGSYTVSGSTGTNSFWTGDKDGDKMWHRYTGTPLLGLTGLVPPGGAAFQVIAGDMILWKWDAAATKWRALTGMRADGTALISSTARSPVSVRQAVLSGPVDANGLPNFGGSTGATTVTAAGTIVATAANSEDASGNVDRVGSKSNPSWTGLSTNGTMYLFVDVNADGTLTEGSTTVAPAYQFGGTYSVSAGAFTFNTQEMVGKVGNGAAAAQTYRVFVGEVTVSAAVVSVITWYALKGRFLSAFISTLPTTSTVVTFTHNLGFNHILATPTLIIECTSTDNGYAVGDRILVSGTNGGASTDFAAMNIAVTSRLAAQIATGGAAAFVTTPKGGGTTIALTLAKWKYAMSINRGW